jgi:hypothetical protein
MSRYSRKTIVAFKRHKDLYWFRPEPYAQSQRWSSACSSLECSEVLTIRGPRIVEEVGELELGLGEGPSEGKLREPRENGHVVRMRMIGCPERRPCLPLHRVWSQVTNKEVLLTEGSWAWGRGPSKLGLQVTPSCGAHPGVAIIMVLCSRHGMAWRGATVPAMVVLWARRCFASHPTWRGLAMVFVITSWLSGGIVRE